jgi:trigger factor
MRVEVDAAKVDETFAEVSKDFQKQANLPGFRPGKAPKEMVLRKYGKDIEEEVKRKLINDSYKKAVEEQKFDVLSAPEIEEIQFDRGQPLQFVATLEIAPEFELPDYKNIPVKLEEQEVTDSDVEKALDLLRAQQPVFTTVDRPLQTGDIAVVNFTGRCEGKLITEIAPTAAGLTEKKNFWIETTAQNAFIPGFSEQLIGAKAGERRTVTVEFPADFVTPQLAGKQGAYDVEMVEVKEKGLPPLDDSLAKAFGAESLEKLREGVRRDLENELSFKKRKSTRNQIVRSLLDRVNFELPESAVTQQTTNIVYEILGENQKRGVSRDAIEQHKDEIYSAAAQGAKERVKVAFILQKIAEKENFKVSQEEMAHQINHLASLYQIPADKFAKDLQKRNGLIEIFDQILNEKTLNFLQQNANIEGATAGSAPEVNPS